MVFVNSTGVIGSILVSSVSTTGDIYLSFLILIAVIVAFFLMFGVSLEWTSLFVVPVMLGFTAYYNGNLGVLGALLTYIAIIFARNFFVR